MIYYAVLKGFNRGIYTNWELCRKNVIGFKGAIFKKFKSMNEAQTYIKNQNQNTVSKISSHKNDEILTFKDNNDFFETIITEPGEILIDVELYQKLNYSYSNESICVDTVTKTCPVYVDGSSKKNGQSTLSPSGYGVFFGKNDKRNAAISLMKVDNVFKNKPTNQRAELFAIKHALIEISNEIFLDKKLSVKYLIYSDSIYAKNCFTVWYEKWMKNSWKNSKGLLVSNLDIIKSIIPLLNYINYFYLEKKWNLLKFYHVKGHNNDYGNEFSDKLANIGADCMKKDLNFVI